LQFRKFKFKQRAAAQGMRQKRTSEAAGYFQTTPKGKRPVFARKPVGKFIIAAAEGNVRA
jgi:hypothetical protein